MNVLRRLRLHLARSWAAQKTPRQGPSWRRQKPDQVFATAPAQDGPVVVGVAGSDVDGAVVGWAAREAALRRCELVLVHAWQPANVGRAPYAPPCEPGHDKLRADFAADVLAAADRAARAAAPSVTTRLIAVPERTAPTLLTAAEHAALLVLGRRRHTEAPDPTLGPVARACTRKARCPVVTVPASPRPSHPAPHTVPCPGSRSAAWPVAQGRSALTTRQ